MRTGSKAWEGTNIAIVGRIPIVPAQIEVQIEETFPSDAVRVKSFETYEQALTHCQDEKTVGFFLLVDDQERPGPAEIFRNLAQPYRNTGWPAFGAVLYDKTKTLRGVEQLVADRRLFSYLPIDDFTNVTACSRTMFQLWEKFVESTEATLFTERFRESVLSCANAALSSGSLHFYDRSLTLLSSNLNLAWRDRICLRWTMAVKAAEKHDLEFMAPHEDITSIFRAFSDTHSRTITEALAFCNDRDQPLSARLYDLLMFLNHTRVDGTLACALADLASNAKPGAGALIKAVKQAEQAVLQLVDNVRATG